LQDKTRSFTATIRSISPFFSQNHGKISELREEIADLKIKVDQLKSLAQPQGDFIAELLQNAYRAPSGRRYSTENLLIMRNDHSISAECYEFFRNLLPLPSSELLRVTFRDEVSTIRKAFGDIANIDIFYIFGKRQIDSQVNVMSTPSIYTLRINIGTGVNEESN